MMELDGVPVGTDELAALALLNYGHFTTVRLDDARVRGLDLHLERLARDCAAVFGTRLDVDRVRELARRLAVRADSPAIMRITVYDPGLALERPGAEARPRVLVSLRPAGAAAPPPLRLRAVPYQRDRPEIKHTGLFGALHQRRLAQRAGVDDVLFVDPTGQVTEGATWNVGFLVDGEVHWPAATVLPGVTMRLLDTVLRGMGVRVRRVRVTPDQIADGRGAFVTNAGIGIRPVSHLDGRALPVEQALLADLRAGYDALPAEPF